MQHQWTYFRRWNFVACQKCGILQNARNKEATNCKGVVKVGPRADEE